MVKQVEGLKNGYLKYYCKFANILASQRDYTVAVYQYMLSLGVMAKGDYICVNQDVHSDYQSYDTELEMRAHWEKCHKIALTEEFNMLVLPDSTKEPAQLIKLPMLVAAADTGTRSRQQESSGDPTR